MKPWTLEMERSAFSFRNRVTINVDYTHWMEAVASARKDNPLLHELRLMDQIVTVLSYLPDLG